MRVKASVFAEYPLLLPPLPEQRRIVAKIEELFTQLDAGVEALRKVQTQLKRYRQSVLKAAVEGRLTAAWRETHKGELEPAPVLLERIRTERRAKWEAEQLARFAAQGKHPKDDSWKARYQEPPKPDTSDLPVLPEGWCWTTVGTLFEVKPGGTPSRAKAEYWAGDFAWVSSGEVANCHIKETREAITALGLKDSSAKLHPAGTVLLAMIGEGKTRGQAAILDIPAATNQNVAAILCANTDVLPDYTYFLLMAQYASTRSGGSGGMQLALNAGRVKDLTFSLPPLSEQTEIVEEVERRLSLADEIEKTVTQSLEQAERLRQSILKKAFEGRLVPQDPTDEPAEHLLERIRQEKANRETVRSRTERSKRKQHVEQGRLL